MTQSSRAKFIVNFGVWMEIVVIILLYSKSHIYCSVCNGRIFRVADVAEANLRLTLQVENARRLHASKWCEWQRRRPEKEKKKKNFDIIEFYASLLPLHMVQRIAGMHRTYIWRKREKCFHSISDSLSFCAVIQSLNGRKVNIKCAQRFHYMCEAAKSNFQFSFFFFSDTIRSVELIASSRRNETNEKWTNRDNNHQKHERNEKCARVPPGMCVNMCVCTYVCHFNKERMQGSSLIWCWRWW